MSSPANAEIDKQQLQERINALLPPIEAILRGRKPAHYPDALLSQMRCMWEDDFIIETPESYVLLPEELTNERDILPWKGVTNVNPIPSMLIQRKRNIDQAASEQEIRNYKILGLDPYFRRLSLKSETFDAHDPVEICEDSAAQILTRSDLHGLRQALHIIRGKLYGDKRALETQLIIQNTGNGFWDDTLSFLGFDQACSTSLSDMGISVTAFPGASDQPTSRQSTIHALQQIGSIIKESAKPDREINQVQAGDQIYVCSGSSHKAPEIASILATLKGRVRVDALNSKIGIKPREADEESRSLEGNNLEKFAETRDRIMNDIGYEQAAAVLCGKGQKPENVWLLFDDRSLEFLDPRIAKTKAFEPIRNALNPYQHKLVPGAELAPVLKTVSRLGFFRDLFGGAIKEIESENGDEKVDRRIKDTACYIMIRLDWLKNYDPSNPHYISAFSKTESIALTLPQPANDIAQSDSFEAPLSHNNKNAPKHELRTKAQIPNYVATSSEMAGAIRGIAHITGIDQHIHVQTKRTSAQFNDESSKAVYKLATLYSLFPFLKGHGIPNIKRVVASALKNGSYELLNGKDSTYSIAGFTRGNKDFSTMRCGKLNRNRVEDALERLRKLYNDADGFLLTPDTRGLSEVSGLKWLKTLFYFSLVVGKQVHDQGITKKFIGLLDIPKKGKSPAEGWVEQEKLFHYLNGTALLGDRYDLLISAHKTKGALKRALREDKKTYVRPSIIDKDVIHKDDGTKAPPDLYRTTIYCSATLGENTPACKEARMFTTKLAAAGYAIINGGGANEGLMFATSEGVHDFRKWWKSKFPSHLMPRNHITSYQCHDTFEREGGWHKDNDNAVIFRHIEQRMANLQNTDSEILLAGGAGSIQEIAASLLMREWGIVPVQDRPMIIVNQLVDGIPIFTPLIDMMSEAERKKLNVHVVTTTDEALEILNVSRLSMQKRLSTDSIYVPPNNNMHVPIMKTAHNTPV